MKEAARKTELVKRNNARVLAAMGVAPKPSIKKEEKAQADLDILFEKLSRLKAEVKETVEEITDAIWETPNLRYTPLPNSGFTYSLGKYNMQWE